MSEADGSHTRKEMEENMCSDQHEENTFADQSDNYDDQNACERKANNVSKRVHGLALGQVERVINEVLPSDMLISREARIAFQKAASVSILYISSLANNSRQSNGKKRTTLNAQDIRSAIHAAGMSHLIPEMNSLKKRSRV